VSDPVRNRYVIQDILLNKDALSVWATRVMAAAFSQSLPVLVTASTLTKLSLAKVRGNFSLAKARKILLSLFAQVQFSLHAHKFWGHLLTRSRSADFSVRSSLVCTNDGGNKTFYFELSGSQQV
jgi:hypothetical protein